MNFDPKTVKVGDAMPALAPVAARVRREQQVLDRAAQRDEPLDVLGAGDVGADEARLRVGESLFRLVRDLFAAHRERRSEP